MNAGDRMIASVWAQLQHSNWEQQVANAKRDPVRNKKTRAFPPGVDPNYRFYKSRDGKNRVVRFCYSVNRNAAGYYLAWREVIGAKVVRRDHWIASKVRTVCKNKCLARYKALDAKRKAKLQERQIAA